MNIENMTIGEFRSLTKMLSGEASECVNIGRKCIIRTYASGVHFGEVVSRSGREVVLKNSRRLWRWDVKTHGVSLSEVAIHGTTDERSKVCETLPEITLLDALEIIPCTTTAIKVVEGMGVYKS